jgi:hypothetical protein
VAGEGEEHLIKGGRRSPGIVAIDGLADPARLARIDLSTFAITLPPSLPDGR